MVTSKNRELIILLGLLLAVILTGCQADLGNGSPDSGADDGDLSDGDGGGLDPGCTEPPGGGSGGSHVLRFEGDKTRVTLRRLFIGGGVGESSLYELERMVILRYGDCVTIEDPGDLEYQNSHHNWFDLAIGEKQGVRYRLSMEFTMVEPDPWAVSLTATSIDDGTVLYSVEKMVTTGGPLLCRSCPSHVPVLINEFMPHNQSTLADENGDFDPWIELFNPSAADVQLEGYGLTDDPGRPFAWVFPGGTVIPRHAYLIVWADGESTEGALHANFALSPSGGQLRLSAPNGTSTGERTYQALPADQSFVFYWGVAGYQVSTSPSPGAENPP